MANLGVGVGVGLGLHGVLLLAGALVLGLGFLHRRLRGLQLAHQLLSVGLELSTMLYVSVGPKQRKWHSLYYTTLTERAHTTHTQRHTCGCRTSLRVLAVSVSQFFCVVSTSVPKRSANV